MKKRNSSSDLVRQQRNKRYFILLSITIAFIVFYSFTLKNFLSLDSITNLIRSSTVLVILSCGMTFVILTGGVDLSVGANIAVSGMSAAMVINATGRISFASALLGFLVTFLVSCALGLLNGFLMGYLNIPPFIATLATQSLANGITMYVTGGTRIIVENKYYNFFGSKVFSIGSLKLPYMVFPLIILVGLTYFLLNKTSFGRKTYIVGGNPLAAKAVGINVSFQKTLVYLYTGMMAAFSTVLTVGRASSAQPTAGTNLEFNVITAVVMGGITLSGGAGTLTGSMLGCLLMAVMTMGMNMIDIPVYYNNILRGAFILVAVLTDQISNYFVNRNAIRMETKKTAKASSEEQQSVDNNHSIENINNLDGFKVMTINHISKYFPGVQALDDVSFDIKAGTVHALAGENGAGKSTLMKIISGVYSMDSGEILVDGKSLNISNPLDARRKGIATIFQELTLIPELTVAQNVFLGKEKIQGGICTNIKYMNNRTAEIMKHFGLDISPKSKVSSLTVGKQQMVEIARAFDSNAKVVIMDEPTSAISDAEKDVLFGLIKELKKQGVAIIYISHKLNEIFEIADYVTVLRDGKHVISGPINEFDNMSLIRYMVNRDLNDVYQHEPSSIGEEVLRVEGLGWKNKFRNVSFTVYAGEVFGMAGLIGAGRTEIARCICGLEKPTEGKIYLFGHELKIRSTKEALDHGICYVSEDRRKEGIIPLLSVRDNITAASLEEHCHKGIIDTDAEKKTSAKYISEFSIRTPSDLQQIKNLSGGNQQKCCLARVFARNPRLIILDEPTRGIDIGAKAEIHKLIEELAKQGIAIILISSELPEVLGSCDRIAVMAEGNLTTILDNDNDITQEDIMSYATRTKAS